MKKRTRRTDHQHAVRRIALFYVMQIFSQNFNERQKAVKAYTAQSAMVMSGLIF